MMMWLAAVEYQELVILMHVSTHDLPFLNCGCLSVLVHSLTVHDYMCILHFLNVFMACFVM